MRTLDAGRVEEAGIVANQDATGESQLGQRLQAARSQRPGTIGNTFAAFEEFTDIRMRLEALEFFKR